MRDPDRLLRKPPSRLSLLLLEGGMEEKPSARARRRTAEAVAASAGALVTSATAAAATTAAKLTTTVGVRALVGGAAASAGTSAATGAGVLAKWFAVGALAGALTIPVLRAVVPAERTKATAPPRAPTAARPSTLPPQPAATPRSTLEITSAEVRVLPPQDGRGRDAQPLDPSRGSLRRNEPPGPMESAPTAASTALRDAPLLAAEVRFVEQGRVALQRDAFAEALALLAPYEVRFSEPQLLTEVLFLRMEAYSRSGDVPRARALAARIVSRAVAGPQAARAREVLGH